MDSKSLFSSKTFWVNTIGGLLIPVLSQMGVSVSADDIAVLFAAANIILRIITAVPVYIKKVQAPAK